MVEVSNERRTDSAYTPGGGAFVLMWAAAVLGSASCGNEQPAATPEAPTPVTTQTRMVVDSVRVSNADQSRVVILRTEDSERFLPIWIGRFEAQAIAVKLQDVSLPRPLTHDLLGSVIADLGATVQRVVVTEIADGTFYGKVVLEADGRTTEVDSRPSDAIALALRVQAPIFVEDSLLEAVGVDAPVEPDVPLLGGDETIN